MKLLLLDFNGVIVHDESLHFATFRDVLAGEGIQLDEATYEREFLGMGNDVIAFRKALGDGAAEDRVQFLAARKTEAYRREAARALPLIPGVSTFVRAASTEARIAVVSGAWKSEVVFGLECAGLAGLVETIVAAEDIRVGKPEPEGLRTALARLGMRQAEVVVIEDSLPGLEAARALGAGCVMIASSHDHGTLRGADAVWDSFDGHEPAELRPIWREVRA